MPGGRGAVLIFEVYGPIGLTVFSPATHGRGERRVVSLLAGITIGGTLLGGVALDIASAEFFIIVSIVSSVL